MDIYSLFVSYIWIHVYTYIHTYGCKYIHICAFVRESERVYIPFMKFKLSFVAKLIEGREIGRCFHASSDDIDDDGEESWEEIPLDSAVLA